MEKNGGKTDYSRITSRQIAVYKTDKALLELVDSLKPAGASYPAHIHASGEEDEEGYSLIRLQMVDYSAGTGQKSVSVYANISPDEALYLYSRIFSGVQTFFMSRQKIFGEAKKEGYANVTKLMVSRYETDRHGSGHLNGNRQEESRERRILAVCTGCSIRNWKGILRGSIRDLRKWGFWSQMKRQPEFFRI